MAKLKRKDSIFGLHFDFHAGPQNESIGATTNEEMVQKIIDLIKPDFIQCDTKGHPGCTSYPSKLGNTAPIIEKDILKIWREVTEKNDVALYSHYSGNVDKRAVQEHPEWGVQIPKGNTVESGNTNVFCSYKDEVLIPQLSELAEDYEMDGVWVDGDCWGVLRDQSEITAKKFFEKYNCEKLPYQRGDQYFDEYLDMLREEFLKYLNDYTKRIHAKYPDYQIASNWAFTTYMPQSVCADIDFISGDVFALDMINHLKYESKFMSQQKVPWDLMTWSMSLIPAVEGDPGGNGQYFASKTDLQLQQEASVVLAHGGAFQVYYTQNKDGSVNLEEIKSSVGLADFCNARKPYCFRGESKAEIAVFYSGKTAYKMANEAFGFMDGTLKFVWGNVKVMSSIGTAVDFIHEDTLTEKINSYSLIVIPEWAYLENKEQLLKFAENGGNLLIIGTKAVEFFQEELGVTVDSVDKDSRFFVRQGYKTSSIGRTTNIANITLKNAKVIDYIYNDYKGAESRAGATVKNYGKGKIAGIYFDLGLIYEYNKDIRLSDFVKGVVGEILPQKFVEVTGTRDVEVTALEKDGKLCINLVNTSGPHTNPTILTYDSVPSVYDFTVKVKCEKPKKVMIEPTHTEIPYVYENGVLEVKIEKLEMYDILTIE